VPRLSGSEREGLTLLLIELLPFFLFFYFFLFFAILAAYLASLNRLRVIYPLYDHLVTFPTFIFYSFLGSHVTFYSVSSVFSLS